MRTAWRICLVAVLVVLAGCGGQAERQPTTTLTPVPFTSSEPTPTPDRIAPGVTTGGVVAPSALAETHVDRLENASIWFRYNQTVRHGDRLRLRQRRSIDGLAGPNATRYRVNVTRVWPNESTHRRFYRVEEAGVIYAIGDPAPGLSRTNESLPVNPYFGARIERLLSTLAGYEISQRTANGTRGLAASYRLTADRFVPGGELSGRNVSFRARLTPGGVVMAYHLSYDSVRNGTRTRVSESLVYETVVFEDSR